METILYLAKTPSDKKLNGSPEILTVNEPFRTLTPMGLESQEDTG
jgi:hypothetical protein